MKHSVASSIGAVSAQRLRVVIQERYGGRPPLKRATAIVAKQAAFLGDEVMSGLSSIVLTDSAMLDSQKLVGGKRIAERECEAFYHQATRHRQPWIELVMDNIAASEPAALLRVPLMRELVIARAFFHEMGHHVYRSVGGVRFPEGKAETWSADAVRGYFASEHPVFTRLGRILLRLTRRRQG